jgi:hypothetical protein
MALQSMTALASITLQEASASVTFSGIPQNYRDLILVFDGTATASASSLRVEVNGDTASNYSFVRAGGNGSSTFSSSVTAAYLPLVWSNQELGTTRSNAILQAMDYSATDRHKTFLLRENNNNTSGTAVVMYGLRWANTTAINQLRIFVAANSITAGSTFNLYGRIA